MEAGRALIEDIGGHKVIWLTRKHIGETYNRVIIEFASSGNPYETVDAITDIFDLREGMLIELKNEPKTRLELFIYDRPRRRFACEVIDMMLSNIPTTEGRK